jgi:hypothetical protein
MRNALERAASEEIEALCKVTGRRCGACTLCCFVLGVDAPDLTKPPVFLRLIRVAQIVGCKPPIFKEFQISRWRFAPTE